MSPLRSSAGPATQRIPTPSSSRTMYARLVLPRPGGPDEQDVVERLLASLGRVERDRELFLDPLLADELRQPARTQRLLEVFLFGDDGRCEELRHGSGSL